MGLLEDFEELPLSSQLALIGAAGLGFLALSALLGRKGSLQSVAMTGSIAGGGLSVSSAGPLKSSEERISSLHPQVASRARELVKRAAGEGMPIVVTQALRSMEQQAALYAQGRTAPGAIVTNSPPGSSWHNYALAFDIAPLDASGQPHWPDDEGLWQRLGAIGKQLGLTWGGDFRSFKDRPHFEYHPGLTLDDARAGRTIA